MEVIKLMELYETDWRFRTYVDKYATTHKMLPEDAVKCIMVREYAKYLRGEQNNEGL